MDDAGAGAVEGVLVLQEDRTRHRLRQGAEAVSCGCSDDPVHLRAGHRTYPAPGQEGPRTREVGSGQLVAQDVDDRPVGGDLGDL